MATRGGKPGANLKVTSHGLNALRVALRDLAAIEVLVGYPDETADRQEDAGTTTKGSADLGAAKADITNAALAYIHDNGEPAANIPARPFMIPGIKAGEARIANQLLSAAKAVIKNPGTNVMARMIRVGVTATVSIKKTLNEGVAPPLSDVTLRKRAAKGRKGALRELKQRAEGLPPGMDAAKPLVDTAQMRNACSYVIRRRKDRKK